MLPLFGADDASSKRRRQINLGGTSSGASQASLLEQAKARRDERDAQRRKHDAAVRIQSWWRRYRERRTVRSQLKEVVRNDTKGVRGLRALVLIGRDGEALSIWATAMDSPGK
jgi:ubiquitin-protein ligase E3 C